MGLSFFVEFCNDIGVFHPNDIVTGSVVLKLEQPLKAQSLMIKVAGKALTKWMIQRGTPAQHGTSRSVTFQAEVNYANGHSVAWYSPKEGEELPIGIHRFPFSFKLPESCAPSFEGMYGYIRYLVEGELARPWKFNKKTTSIFSVIPNFDLNLFPESTKPVRDVKFKELGILIKSGTIKLECCIPKMGYVPGETVTVDVVVANQTTKSVDKITVRLLELSRYIAYEDHKTFAKDHDFKAHAEMDDRRRIQEREIATVVQNYHIRSKSRESFRFDLPIPSTSPTFECCPIINVEHYVEVKVITAGLIKSSVRCQCPILIGTVPIKPRIIIEKPDSADDTPAPTQTPQPTYEPSAMGTAGTTLDADSDGEKFIPLYPVYNLRPPNKMPAKVDDEEENEEEEEQQ